MKTITVIDIRVPIVKDTMAMAGQHMTCPGSAAGTMEYHGIRVKPYTPTQNIYSRFLLPRHRLSRITAYLEVKIWSLF